MRSILTNDGRVLTPHESSVESGLVNLAHRLSRRVVFIVQEREFAPGSRYGLEIQLVHLSIPADFQAQLVEEAMVAIRDLYGLSDDLVQTLAERVVRLALAPAQKIITASWEAQVAAARLQVCEQRLLSSAARRAAVATADAKA